MFKRLYKNSGRENGTLHYEDCQQLFMTVGHCYLIEALLEFFKVENVDESPTASNTFLPNDISDEEKKAHLLTVLHKFVD